LVGNDGRATFAFLKWLQSIGTTVNGAFDSSGNYQGPIGDKATIDGRETLASIVENIGVDGVVTPEGLPAATNVAQGAVFMPVGAPDNHLGTAAIRPTTDFDPAGAAGAAQAAAEAHADSVAAAAQSNAESFATAADVIVAANAANASNLTSGTVDVARLPGISITITTAALTGLGTQGSMTFTNGILTAQTPAT
jgi:hypothetical protein